MDCRPRHRTPRVPREGRCGRGHSARGRKDRAGRLSCTGASAAVFVSSRRWETTATGPGGRKRGTSSSHRIHLAYSLVSSRVRAHKCAAMRPSSPPTPAMAPSTVAPSLWHDAGLANQFPVCLSRQRNGTCQDQDRMQVCPLSPPGIRLRRVLSTTTVTSRASAPAPVVEPPDRVVLRSHSSVPSPALREWTTKTLPVTYRIARLDWRDYTLRSKRSECSA